MKRITMLLVAAGALLCCLPAQAHHSFAAMYRAEETIEVEGQIVQFLFRNPHSFVHIMAPDGHGGLTRWTIEWSAASALNTGGLQADTLKRGDVIVVTGTPGRNPDDHRIRLKTLHRLSDGFGWGTAAGETVD
jgi:Family of unknown function (DUF6152)